MSTLQYKNSKSITSCKGETCYPMYIYLLIAIPGLVGSFFAPQTKGATSSQKLAGAIGGGLWIAFWSFLMWELCKHCHRGWAWFMLFLPLILGIGIGITIGIIIYLLEKNKNSSKR